MIDPFHFVHINGFWPIVIIAILTWLLFGWKESPHYGRPKFIIHLGVALIAISSLALIALQPQIRVKKEKKVAVLLTEGYDQEKLDSLKKTLQKFEVYPYTMGETIFDPDEIPSAALILGNGIRPFDFWQLEKVPTRFLGGKELKGVTQINYDADQIEGNRIQFNGTYTRPVKNHQLFLEGPGGNPLDSVLLTDRPSQLFELSTDLNVVGNFKFYLVERDSLGAVISQDILPVSIAEKSPLKILMLNGFPTFETKYLKNYLAEAGHLVVVKNQLTTARYKYEYFNMTSKPIIDITQEQLAFFDLLIMDTKSLKGLSNRQLSTLKSTISELGMGLLIQADADYFSGRQLISSFTFDREPREEAFLAAYPQQQLKKYPYQFRNGFSIQIIHRTDGKIWSAYERLGSGRVGSSVFQNTFELVLDGHTKTYHAFWSEIIEKLSKRTTPAVQWDANHRFAYKDQPFEFELRTTFTQPIVESSEGYAIPLQRDVHVKSLWKGQVYPRATGWKQQYLNQDSSEVFHYYVTDSAQWKSITRFNTLNSNQIYFNETSKAVSTPDTTLKRVNPLWFFLVFMVCAGYLWLEPKL
ncbi:MAG TPA: hypothetical protein VJ953_00120 [Saprospiraceae bacterium]|nr:hypothetical protein [Saprospiraceae bacterium]HKL90052.1 hypothetical protein [Allomuricauda sp.]